MDLSILIQLLWDGATNQQRWGLNTIENPAIGCASHCISVNGSFKSTSPNHQVIMVEIFSMPYIKKHCPNNPYLQRWSWKKQEHTRTRILFGDGRSGHQLDPTSLRAILRAQ
jgi:hypothetical protein